MKKTNQIKISKFEGKIQNIKIKTNENCDNILRTMYTSRKGNSEFFNSFVCQSPNRENIFHNFVTTSIRNTSA